MGIVCNSDTNRNIIMKEVKKIMIDLNIKNNDIAKNIGQTDQSTSNLLNPNYRPDGSMTIDTLARICDAMNCDLVVDIVKRD